MTTTTQTVKVYTPVKRVPTMVGKAPNGQKLPFGPFTLHQIAAATATAALTGIGVLMLPVNPAVTGLGGAAATAAAIFALGLVPYTGVRLTSRAMWISRLILARGPVRAGGQAPGPPARTGTNGVFIHESRALVLAQRTGQRR